MELSIQQGARGDGGVIGGRGVGAVIQLAIAGGRQSEFNVVEVITGRAVAGRVKVVGVKSEIGVGSCRVGDGIGAADGDFDVAGISRAGGAVAGVCDGKRAGITGSGNKRNVAEIGGGASIQQGARGDGGVIGGRGVGAVIQLAIAGGRQSEFNVVEVITGRTVAVRVKVVGVKSEIGVGSCRVGDGIGAADGDFDVAGISRAGGAVAGVCDGKRAGITGSGNKRNVAEIGGGASIQQGARGDGGVIGGRGVGAVIQLAVAGGRQSEFNVVEVITGRAVAGRVKVVGVKSEIGVGGCRVGDGIGAADGDFDVAGISRAGGAVAGVCDGKRAGITGSGNKRNVAEIRGGASIQQGARGDGGVIGGRGVGAVIQLAIAGGRQSEFNVVEVITGRAVAGRVKVVGVKSEIGVGSCRVGDGIGATDGDFDVAGISCAGGAVAGVCDGKRAGITGSGNKRNVAEIRGGASVQQGARGDGGVIGGTRSWCCNTACHSWRTAE